MATATGEVEVRGSVEGRLGEILTPQALEFLATLQTEFSGRREELLARRRERRDRLSAGELLDFLPDTRDVLEVDCQVSRAPDDL